MGRLGHRLTANISFLFEEYPFVDRFDAARSAGFGLVECHFPYDLEVDVLKGRLERAAVRLTGINTPPGNVGAGEWGWVASPAGPISSLISMRRCATRTVWCEHDPCDGGCRQAARATSAPRDIAREPAAWAAKARDEGITLLLEPLNQRDKPDYLLGTTDDVAEIIASIGAPNVALLFDIYHVQIMEGDLTTRLERHSDIIGHVQISGVPDRGEPDRSEIALGHILGTLDAIGYAGLIGLEYRPRGPTTAGLMAGEIRFGPLQVSAAPRHSPCSAGDICGSSLSSIFSASSCRAVRMAPMRPAACGSRAGNRNGRADLPVAIHNWNGDAQEAVLGLLIVNCEAVA